MEVLKKEVQAVAKPHGMKVRVVESGGKSLKRSLQRSDVEPDQSCGLPCVICESGGKQCHLETVGYQVECKECELIGERTVMHGGDRTVWESPVQPASVCPDAQEEVKLKGLLC